MSTTTQPQSAPRSALQTFGGDSDDPMEQQVASEALIILFTFAGLLLGAILREVSKKTKVPYTPLLIVAGIFVGIYITQFGVVGDAVEQALILEPHAILMIFIPTLIFESAFNADWYVLKKVAINVVLLAGPGVLINIFLLAFTLKVILGYEDDDITWKGALTLGSILSTVDPISIVPLLKELGAPVKFNLLAEGEALVNGGVSMVFFTLFLNMTTLNVEGAQQVALSFLQLAGGGPLLGFIFGVIASMWLSRITRDNTLSITITFISCYLLFFAAETQLHVSGILALTTLGLFISAYGKTKIDTEAENALHAVWSWAQYGCETLIYLIAGLLIGYEAIFQQTTTIETGDWYRMIVFYVFVIASRAVSVGVFFPILKRHGYSITGKELVVLIWGGMKGALGLCLALMIAMDGILPRRMREIILFYTTGIVLLTVLINGTTCSWLIERMEMVIEPEVKNRLQKNLIAEMIMQSREKEEILKEDKFLTLSDWNAVTKLVGNDELSKEFTKGPTGAQPQVSVELQDMNNYEPERSSYQPLKDDDMFQETRFRLLRIMKGIYWEKYEQGLIAGEAARLLIKGVNVSLDSTEKPIDLWSFLFEYFTSFRLLKFFIKLKDFFLIGRLAKSYITSHVAFIYEITTAFIEVCAEVLEIDESIPLSKNHIQTVFDEVSKNRLDAENYMLDLQSNFLEIMRAIQVRRAAYQILDEQKHFLEEMMHTGQIEEKEYSEIRRKIDRKLNALEDLKIDWHFPTFNEFVAEFPIFSDLTTEEARELQRESKQKTFHKGDFLYEMHAPCNGVFFVTKGRATESVDINRAFARGAGSILSFANLVSDQRKAVMTCEAFSDVQTTFIPFEKLDPIMQRNAAFEEKVYKNSLFTFFMASYDKNIHKLKLNEVKINEILRKSKLKTYKEGDRFVLENGGFLFSGAITKAVNADESERFKANNYTLIPPNSSELSATKLTKILVFERDVRDIFEGFGPFRNEERRESAVGGHGPKKSVRVSFREAFQRDMFDKEFKNMMGKNKYDDYLS